MEIDTNLYIVYQAGFFYGQDPQEFEDEESASKCANQEAQFADLGAWVVAKVDPDGKQTVIEIWFDGEQYT
jgi:hypothetical protein